MIYMSYGRTKIYSNAKEINAANVVEEVSNAYSLHCRNQADIKTLWDCYRGRTKILHKTKEIREEINHKINFFLFYQLPYLICNLSANIISYLFANERFHVIIS